MGRNGVLMSFRSNIRVSKLQNRNKMMALGTCKANERRKKPFIPVSVLFGDPNEMKDWLKRYDNETKQLLKEGVKLI
jgi:hypothetical protein